MKFAINGEPVDNVEVEQLVAFLLGGKQIEQQKEQQKENPMNIEKRLNELENNITALNKRLDESDKANRGAIVGLFEIVEGLIDDIIDKVEVDQGCGSCCCGCDKDEDYTDEDSDEDNTEDVEQVVDIGPDESMIDLVELHKWYFVWDTSEGDTFKDARVMTSCAAYSIEEGGVHFVDTPRDAEHFANGKEVTVTFDKGVCWKEIEDRFLGQIVNGKTQQGKLYFVWKKSRRDCRVLFADGKGTFVECRRDLNQGLGEYYANFEELDYETVGVIENIKGVGASYAQ